MVLHIQPQCIILLTFHFSDHDDTRRNWFEVGPSLFRRVPMELDGVTGLNTVGMWFDEEKRFIKGDQVLVEAATLWPQAYRHIIKVGSKGRLWDGGFFADVEVTDVDDDAIEQAIQRTAVSTCS